MKFLVLVSTLIHASLGASLSVGGSCPLFCTEQYDPVCGSDGKTYSNMCFFNIGQCHDATLTLSHYGSCTGGYIGQVTTFKPCQNVACFALYDPVCGSNGITYGNSCELHAANCGTRHVTLAHKGPCGSVSITG